MLDQLLSGSKDELINTLTAKLGVSDAQAGGFLGSLLERVEDLLKGGKLDVSSLLSGDTSTLKGLLNMEALGGLLGGDAKKAEAGVEAVIDPIAKDLGGNAGMLDQLQGMLGGDKAGGGAIDAAAGIAGKLFGKK
ncbi:MAG: hypothetical protein DHS20C14_17040 [Phycisphaeraceae bacterium]|nr:MAG: hypothetical protein DHS20C14_17040 [Phycisphaeraceae bacterium]